MPDGALIPVYQTRTVGNDGVGNCFNACVASILELPLRDVCQVLPDFSGDYWKQWSRWAEDRGLEINYRALGDAPPKGFAIASGMGGRLYPEGHRKAGREILHAVVVFNGETIHDPFPGGKGIDRPRYYWTIDAADSDENKVQPDGEVAA
jgi:hypothetical protein